VKDASATATTRVDALYALQALKAKELAEALTLATTATDARLRAAAKIIAAKANDQTGDLQLTQLILDDAADVTERKMALDALAGMKESGAIDRALVTLLEKSIKGEVPTAMKLEVIEAAEARTTAKKLKLHEDVKTKLSEHVAAIRKTAGQNLLKRYTDCLEGGDAAKGREVFLSNAAAACQRCHKLEGQGGDVGPAMETLKKEHTREYLLEAVVVPNAHIAEGYQSVIVQTAEGRTVTGVLRRKEKDKYVIITPENKTVEVLREDIESEKPDRSAMPEDVYKKLTRRELRDVVEFLAGLRK
jgi:quinoprotein glucose dehydrogenase